MEEAVHGAPVESGVDRVPQLVVAILVMVGSSMLMSWFFDRKSGKAEADAPAKASDTEKEWDGTPPAEWPEDGIFTMESLAKFDGRSQPLCLAICGKVVDCSKSDNIKPGFGYGKLWAGRDGTRAFALCSLKPEMANDMDWKLGDFSESEFKALAGWYKHFTKKYPVKGTLKEYDSWDFSSVVEASVHETPFSSQSSETVPSSDPAPEATIPSSPATPPTSSAAPQRPAAVLPEGGIMLKKGDRVEFHGLSGRADLNGKVGTLADFVREKQRFAVVPEGDDEPVLVQAKNIKS
jgi:membrane-associated progesterone receptor component